MNSLEILLDFTWIARRKRHWWRYCQSRPREWKVWGCRAASPPPWVLPGGWGWWLPTLGPLRLSGSSLLLCWCWRRSRRIYFSPIWTQNTSKRKTVVDALTCRQWQDSVLTGEGRRDKLRERSTSQSEADYHQSLLRRCQWQNICFHICLWDPGTWWQQNIKERRKERENN